MDEIKRYTSGYDHFSPEDIEKVRKEDTKIILPETMASKTQKVRFLADQICQVQQGQSYDRFGLRFTTVLPATI